MKIVVSAELIKSLNKKKDAAQLNYFKKELIKVLEKNDEEIVSKAIEDYDNSIKKTYSEIGIEKAGYGIGTVRVWKGQKFRKIAPGKWRRIYDSNTRGARQSINIIKKKIANAQSIDELLQLVMENTNRFMDADGKLLPIVEELQNAVKESKGRLNTGKPSTQEQIEQFKKEKGSNKPVFEIDIKDLKVGDRFKNGYKIHTVENVEEKDTYMGKQVEITTKEGKLSYYPDAKIKLINPDYSTPYSERMKKIEAEIDEIGSRNYGTPEDKIGELRALKELEAIKYRSVVNEWDREHENNWKDYRDERQFIVDTYDRVIYDKLNPLINELFEQTEEQVEKRKKEKEAKEKKWNDLNNKIAEANKIVKSYSDDEIQAAFTGIDEVIKGYNELKGKYTDLLNQKKETQRKQYEIHEKAKKDLGVDYVISSKLRRDYPEYKGLDEEYERLSTEAYRALQDLREYSNTMDPYLGPVAYYYLNKFEYKQDDRIDSCKTTKEVSDLIKEKNWFSDKGKANLDLKNIDVNAAKDMFKTLERIFAIFPEQKGMDYSVNTNYSNSNVWAVGGTYSGITLNRKYYNNYEALKKDYERHEGSFHPKGTKAKDVISHEYYHVMTIGNEVDKTIYKIVTKKLNMRGSKGGAKLKEVIQKGVSQYACKDEHEFGAECFCQAMGSDNPTGFAIEVFKQTLKFKKYMRGLV